MTMLYNELVKNFGGSDPFQMFTMVFPTQPLNYRDFVYDTSDRNSQLSKPQAVAEAEFRLCDQLVDPAPVVGAPNGKTLSVVYEQLLDCYVPDMAKLNPYLYDRADFHAFLQRPITVGDKTSTRMDLFNQYFEVYTEAKRDWNSRKQAKREIAVEGKSDFDLDDFASWVASISPAEHAKIDASYSMIVTSGYLHETFSIIGYLNSGSPAENLERAKQALRHASRGAIDEAGSVYPVKFEPSNWFEAMRPNLNPEDLTMAADALISTLRARREQLRSAQGHLNNLKAVHVSSSQLEALAGEAKAARSALEASERELMAKYGSGTMNMVKTIISMKKGAKDYLYDAAQSSATNESRLNSLLGAAGFGGMDTIQTGIQNAIADTEAVYAAQQANIRKIDDYEEANRKLEAAQSNDFQLQIRQAQQRVSSLEEEIRELEELVINIHSSRKNDSVDTEGWESMLKEGEYSDKLNALDAMIEAKYKTATVTTKEAMWSAFKAAYPNATANNATINLPETRAAVTTDTVTGNHLKEVGLRFLLAEFASSQELSGDLPRSNLTEEMDSMFTTITIVVDASAESAMSTSTSTSSSSSTSVSAWFASYSSNRSSSSASSSQRSMMQKSNTTIAMRVMKVGFQRPWFQPSLLEKTGDFQNLGNRSRAGLGITKEQMMATTPRVGTPYAQTIKDAAGVKDSNTYILPAYPVAMLIAKDITIKMSSSENIEGSWNESQKSSSSSSGGFLCFGSRSSSSSSSKASGTYASAKNRDVVIRIPGPQILGYINQLVPKDESVPYRGISSNVTFQEVMDKYAKLLGG